MKFQPHQSLSDIGFHQSANATTISDKVYSRITDQQDKEAAREETITAERLDDQQMQYQMQQTMNSIQQTTSMLEQINILDSTIKTLESRVNNNRGIGYRGGNRGGRSGGGKDRRQGNNGKYCW